MYDPRRDYNNVQVFPVNFATMHKDMLTHTNELLSAKKIKIHPIFPKVDYIIENRSRKC